MQKHIIISAALVVVVGAASFYGGMKFSESKGAASHGQRLQQFSGNLANGQGGTFIMKSTDGTVKAPNAANGTAFTAGKIVQVGPQSITVQMQDGSSKVILYSSSTQINKEAVGSATDLASGSTITVQGESNSDGSITAKTIQVR